MSHVFPTAGLCIPHSSINGNATAVAMPCCLAGSALCHTDEQQAASLQGMGQQGPCGEVPEDDIGAVDAAEHLRK